MAKLFSPYRVKNPQSAQHVVRLRRGQSLNVILDKKLFGDAKVYNNCPGLVIDSFQERPGDFIYTYAQEPAVQRWAEYSSSMLGEIWIDTKTNVSRLVIMLESDTAQKRHHVTVVNPDCYEVRLRPGDILETVLFEKSFDICDGWDYEWIPEYRLGVELLGIRSIRFATTRQPWENGFLAEPPEHPYACHPRIVTPIEDLNPCCQQHHYWFRFGPSLMMILKDSKPGVQNVGKFRFHGYSNRYQKKTSTPVLKVLTVYLDLCKSYIPRVDASFGLKLMSEMAPSEPSRLDSALVSKPTPRVYEVGPDEDDEEDTVLCNDSDFDHSGLCIDDSCLAEALMSHYSGNSNVRIYPSIRDVEMTLLENHDLEDGCRYLSASPPPPSQVQNLPHYPSGTWPRQQGWQGHSRYQGGETIFDFID